MPHNPTMQSGVRAALECQTTCTETVIHCLMKGGAHAEPSHIRMLLDCAEICQLAANFMSRESDAHPRVCEVCAEVCERCATSCEQLADDDDMRRCAEACRSCAESCREMAGADR